MRKTCLALVLLLFACSTGGGTIDLGGAPDVALETVAKSDITVEVGVVDIAGADATEIAFAETLEVALEEVILPGCEPGEGCFGDLCDDNSDCQSGWCVQHMGEGVCSTQCQEECPAGWSCQQVAGTEPDVVYICVSAHANLCRPCAESGDCKSVGGADDNCIDYGFEGSFCGSPCADGEGTQECPWGFSCKTVATVDGVELPQCIADAGVCPCTDSSVAMGLWTPCQVSNEWGTCSGKRVCQEAGLSECDSGVPAGEDCNGLDDDCDDEIDEPLLVDGKYEELCDDDNQCTEDSCKGAEGCVNLLLDDGECTDGNPCTVADNCTAGICAGNPVECDDANPCTDNACTETGGCEFPPAAGSCDDGNPCTLADQCVDGECEGTQVSCECLVDQDCELLEDGDLCNGTLYCSAEVLPHLCMVDPDSVVECPEPQGPNALCLAAFCAPGTGECSLVPANEQALCETDDACTFGDRCQEGVCAPGNQVNCNDGNVCTDDGCDPEAGCVYEFNQVDCNDGDVCTAGDQCNAGECIGGLPLVCDDGNACNGVETCDPEAGCAAGQALVCDDGNACNGAETCDPDLKCVGGQPLVCSDGNPCTADSCDAQLGCIHTPSDDPCDDDNQCTVGDVCAQGKCQPGQALPCNDDDVCTTDSCQPDSGCIYVLNQAPCDDLDLCTVGDHCHLGACTSSSLLVCDDGNACTDDSCSSEAGCQFVPNQAGCDDGSDCTDGDVCKGGWCAGSPVVCDDEEICTDDSCVPGSGCVFKHNAAPCDDGDACTLTDACSQGICAGGDVDDCDDGNVCTDDSCLALSGCQNQPLTGAACDDQDPCTIVDSCNNGICAGVGDKDCNDDDVCTADSCVPFAGCVYGAQDGIDCDDADKCTVIDKCVQGACVGSGVPNCDDGNACTNDYCDPPGGCVQQAVVPCCGDNEVDAPEECDDGNTSSGDGCDEDCMKEASVSMAWVDPQTGSCANTIWQTMQQIVAGMPAAPVNVKIVANHVQPTPNYGHWEATFENTTCVRKWLQAIANKDYTTYNQWDPGVCKATTVEGDTFIFICKNDGGGGRQICIYEDGAQPGQLMRLYMIDRTGPWCDLIGVNARPGFTNVHNNSNTSGNAGDSVTFTWWL